jgi:hypothetical protein
VRRSAASNAGRIAVVRADHLGDDNLMKKSNRQSHRSLFAAPVVWPEPTPRRERIASGTYHRPVTPMLAPTAKPLAKKLAKVLRRMTGGDTLRPLGLFRYVQGAWKLLCKIKSHLIHRLEELKLIEYVVGWRVTALGRAAIGLKGIDTSPLVKAAKAVRV